MQNIRTQFIQRLLAVSLLIALALFVPTSAQAAKKDKGGAKDTGVKGSLTAVDKSTKTITVGSKVISTDSTTIFTKSGKPITFDDLKVGEAAEVSTFTLGDKLTAVTVKVGGLPAAGNPPATETPKKKKKP